MNMGKSTISSSNTEAGAKAGVEVLEETSSVVSALAKEENCSSCEDTVVSSGQAGGDNAGFTGAEGTAKVKGSSSLSW